MVQTAIAASPGPSSDAVVIYEGRATWKSEFGRTVLGIVTVPLLVGIFILLTGWIRRASTRYRLTNRRIEWDTGLLSRRIDGVDLWRVRHVDYVQTLADRIFGLSRLEVFCQDGEDPHIVIIGLPAARSVYDQVAAAVQAGRQSTVGLIQ